MGTAGAHVRVDEDDRSRGVMIGHHRRLGKHNRTAGHEAGPPA